MLQQLAELLFPSRCVGCGRHGAVLCVSCRRELHELEGVCSRCALPRSHGGCGCQRLARALHAVRAVYPYDGAARAAVHALKYRGGRHIAGVMGALMRQHLQRRPLRAEVVVPVPLSRRKLRERGYNQAALLAETIADAVGGAVQEPLSRADRPAQQGLTAVERLRNLSGAIEATERLSGRSILLVDDVATTGATLSACAEALQAAGAREIRALVFARDL